MVDSRLYTCWQPDIERTYSMHGRTNEIELASLASSVYKGYLLI